MYNYLDVCKQTTDVKLLLLYSSTWNHGRVHTTIWIHHMDTD